MIGTYTFTRHIDDRYARTMHTATGNLVISQTEWTETGVMHTLNTLDFYQQYHLEFIGNMLNVKYPNGRDFYTIDDIYAPQNIHHQCTEDLYRGTWNLNNCILNIIWQVNGPSKDYTMRTEYTPTCPAIKSPRF